MRKRPHAPQQPVYSVTSAPQSLQDDQSYRMHRYLLSMGTRTVCFLLAVLFIAVLHWTIAGWVMVVTSRRHPPSPRYNPLASAAACG